MLSQQVSCRQREDLIFLDQSRRKSPLPRTRFPKHQHPEELAISGCGASTRVSMERKRKGLLWCMRPPEAPRRVERAICWSKAQTRSCRRCSKDSKHVGVRVRCPQVSGLLKLKVRSSTAVITSLLEISRRTICFS